MTGTNNKETAELGEVYRALQQRLHAYLRKYVSDDTADDILQDVFVKALKAIDAEQSPKNLAAWLFTAARTTVIDYFRANTHRFVDLDDGLQVAADESDRAVEQALAQCLRPLANQLPGIYRDTVLAADFDGEPLHKIAAREGRSVSAIKSRAARGREKLKALLHSCCEFEFESGGVSEFTPRAIRKCC